ncbi:MAG: hypothetical protein R3357_14500 [Burkholderiales bacterium]|nr:hypothetical protein [Burkholderiales bacterium]
MTRGILAYGVFGLVIVALSHLPRYAPVPQGAALLQVSIAHAGARLAPCRRLTAEELAARAPNMRAPEVCPRGRSAVRVTVELDGRVLLDETLEPSGLARDGTSTLYRRIPVAAGERRLKVRVIDDLRAPARAVERSARFALAPGQVLSVDFKPARGGIVFS